MRLSITLVGDKPYDRRHDMNKALPLAVALTLMSGATYAQINKCVDASGKVVYSQSPCPPGQSAGVIRAPAPASQAAAPAAKPGSKPPATPEEAFRQRQKEREEAEQKAAKAAAEEQKQQAECQQARAVVAQYEMGGRVSSVGPDGQRYFLDENQIAQQKARAQDAVKQWCK